MSKRNYRFGGNVTSTVPASRQNIEQRTPSGVRPVASPVTPTGDVLGRSNGGELEMNKPKKMAFGGPSGRMAPGGSKPGAPVNQRVPGVMPQYGGPVPNMAPGGMNPNMAPGAGRMPMAGGFGGSAGPGGFSMDGRANQFARGAMPQYGGRVPGMKKGGMASASSYEDMTGGAAGGIGRLEKSSIAAKTKSQKLKKGGKVKMADGGLSKADVFAMTGKYGSSADDSGRRDKGLEDYRARQDKREKDAAAKKRAMKYSTPPQTPEGSGKSGRGMEFVDARAKKMAGAIGDIERSMADNQSLEKGLRGIQRNSENANRADKIRDIGRKVAKRNSMAQGALSNDAALPGVSEGRRQAVKAAEYINRFLPEGPAIPPEPGSLSDNIMKYGMKKGGKVMKMAKGGKAEAFEGSAKDMAQDKKLAKKYGMSKKAYEKSEIDAKHDKQKSMKGLKMGGMSKMAMGGYAAGGMSTAQDGMKGALRPKPSAMAKGGKAEMHDKGCKCMACGGMAKKMAKGGAVGMTFGKPLPGTKVSSQKIRATTATGASMKKDGMKGQLRAKASGAKPTNMMKPLGMTKMASGGKVRGTGIAQRGTKFIGEV